MQKLHLILCCIVGLSVIAGCRQKDETAGVCEVSVTNAYLQSAVNDLTGNTIDIFCLAPPGMCPGHFDMSPEQIRRLLNSKALFRFDFQAGLDDKLKRTKTSIVPIPAQSGMCIPQTYLQTCRQTLLGLVEYASINQATAEENLRQLETSLNELEVSLRSQIQHSGLTGTTVLASEHQAEFAKWLGLEVVGTFKGVDGMTPGDIEMCLQAGQVHNVSIVIANLQEGTELPKRIADHLNGRLVVFSNFPETQNNSGSAFEDLLRSNINNLIFQSEP